MSSTCTDVPTSRNGIGALRARMKGETRASRRPPAGSASVAWRLRVSYTHLAVTSVETTDLPTSPYRRNRAAGGSFSVSAPVTASQQLPALHRRERRSASSMKTVQRASGLMEGSADHGSSTERSHGRGSPPQTSSTFSLTPPLEEE